MNEAFDFGGRVWGSCSIKDIVERVWQLKSMNTQAGAEGAAESAEFA